MAYSCWHQSYSMLVKEGADRRFRGICWTFAGVYYVLKIILSYVVTTQVFHILHRSSKYECFSSPTLKRKCHFENIFVIDCIESCNMTTSSVASVVEIAFSFQSKCLSKFTESPNTNYNNRSIQNVEQQMYHVYIYIYIRICPPLELGHGWIIVSLRKPWMQILIHVIILVIQC